MYEPWCGPEEAPAEQWWFYSYLKHVVNLLDQRSKDNILKAVLINNKAGIQTRLLTQSSTISVISQLYLPMLMT
jgi:hypothetical protein